MTILAQVIVGIVALLHIYFLVLEMFLWDKPAGMRTFGHTRERAAATKVLAANQGLYNGFLAAGLLWGLWLGQEGFGVKVFFSGLCAGGRAVWRCYGEPQDPVRAGPAGRLGSGAGVHDPRELNTALSPAWRWRNPVSNQ